MEVDKKIKNTIFTFLKNNGFWAVKDEKNKLQNTSCIITISENGYEVYDKKTLFSSYSNDHNIYWLIGYLTYNKYIDQKYNII